VIRGWLLLLPAVVFLGIFFAVPIALVATTSVIAGSGGLAFGQYRRFLLDDFYRGFLTETVLVSVVTTAACVVLSFPVAYQLARAKPGTKGVLLTLLIAPLMVGDVVRGYGWLIAIGDFGVVNQMLTGLGIVQKPVRLIFTPTGVVLGLVEVLLPFMVLPLAAAIGGIPPELEEAARSLGARSARVFRKIVFPLSLPGLAAGVVIVFALSMGSFAIPLFLGGVKVNMVGPLIFQQATLTVDWPFAAAVSSVLFATSLLLLMIYAWVGSALRVEAGSR
jgi:putative spermidine/putrescine transport system permease protein